MTILILIILFLPLLNFLLNAGFGKRFIKGDLFSLFTLGSAFVLSLFILQKVWGQNELISFSFNWLQFSTYKITGGFFIDKLSAIMISLVTFVATLVHLFSLSYMKGDAYYHRYWAYLGLFCFAMLGIVMANSLLFIFIFWELVGLSSYLLIGFWFQKDAPAHASQKAFIVNRIGDLGFLAGMLLLFSVFSTFNIVEIQNSLQMEGNQLFMQTAGVTSPISTHLLTLSGLLLFCGCIGKSAQFPLQIWLPDAMQGPTPVSSLIHAATMVAAGVYLTARIYPFLTPDSQFIIATIGAITATMAAIAALTQWDIKRVLAYSTISQLGYMVMGMGVGAYAGSLFHLLTHAFFKCGLFLVSAILIHELHHHFPEIDAQDMRNMGGFRKLMPKTFYVYAICMLALCGLPFFSGFLSKESILIEAINWASGHNERLFVPILGILTAGITAFYMMRHALLIFGGENRAAKKALKEVHFHEANGLMLFPVAILAYLSLWINFSLNPFEAGESWFMRNIENQHIIAQAEANGHFSHTLLSLISLSVILVAFWASYKQYATKNTFDFEQKYNFWQRLSFHHFYQDILYEKIFILPLLKFTELLAKFDKNIVDGTVGFVSRLVVSASHRDYSLSRLAAQEDRCIDKSVDFVGQMITGDAKGSYSLANLASEEEQLIENTSLALGHTIVNSSRATISISVLAAKFDFHIIDGFVNLFANQITKLGKLFRRMQNGKLQNYILFGILGFLLLLAMIVGIAILMKKGKSPAKDGISAVENGEKSVYALLTQVAKDDSISFSKDCVVSDKMTTEIYQLIGNEEVGLKINEMLEPQHELTLTQLEESRFLFNKLGIERQSFQNLQFVSSDSLREWKDNAKSQDSLNKQKYWDFFKTKTGKNAYTEFSVPVIYKNYSLISIYRHQKEKPSSYIALYEREGEGWKKIANVGQAY